jgi:glycosyltransferase involved in cell wall biosynthesis
MAKPPYKPRILFVTPAATRSGAPMLMLHLIRWLRAAGEFEMSAVLVSDGAMSAAFAAELPTVTFEPAARRPAAPVRWLRRQPAVARRRAARRAAACRAVVGRWPPDVVYCGSLGAAGVLAAMGPYPCPVVVGVHELEYVLEYLERETGGGVTAVTRLATHYVAGSRAVEANLVRRRGVPADRVTVVHDFIPTADFPPPAETGGPRLDADRLAAAGVPAGAVVVGSLATLEWRKGADLFVALARLLPPTDAAGRPVHLVWVGGGPELDAAQLRFDVDAAGLGDRVHLVGATGRTADWYPSFTVLAALSREDPFPLVPLEAAACGVPTVCFDGSGGMPEFVEHDAGRIVPFLDLAAFASALMQIVNDPALRDAMGRAAAGKVRARHDVNVAAPLVVDCLRRVLAR